VETRNRRELLLLGVVVALGALAYGVYVEWPGTSAVGSATSNQEGQRSSGGRGDRKGLSGGQADEAPNVHLDALSADRQRPETRRNLFRFKEKPPPPPPPPPPPRVPTAAELAAAAGPPPPAPITVKFYGYSQTLANGKRMGYFMDGDEILLAREGDTLERKYRVVRIGASSAVLEDLNARREQSVPLTAEGPA